MFGSSLRRLSPLLLSALTITALTGLPAGATVVHDAPPPVPSANADLNAACGLDVVLVLDTSGSIANSHAQGDVRDSAKAFLNALVGTGSSASLVSFATQAQVLSPPTALTSGSISGLDATIDGLSDSDFNGATNWEDALIKAQSQFAVSPFDGSPELVVMITDGNPTVYNGNTFSGGSTEQADVDHAVVQANAIKDGPNSPHMLALGVGSDVNEANLKAISGNDSWTGSNLATADWARIADFTDLPSALKAIATALCDQTVVIHKVVNGHPAAGFKFTAPGQDTVTTDSDGVATFSWKAPLGVDTTVTESSKAGYRLDSIECTSGDKSVGHVNHDDGIDLSVGPKERVDCTFVNVRLPEEEPTTTTTTEPKPEPTTTTTTAAPATTTTTSPAKVIPATTTTTAAPTTPTTVAPQVLGETLTQPTAELPRTGSESRTLLLTGAMLLLAGFAVRAGSRKARKA